MQQPPDSIIVKVIEEPVKSTTIVDVLWGRLAWWERSCWRPW